ncbi:hypothetical protein DSO57_1037259 [Entomophthora muscae]|uniref:Uncharacterized protein n=1 Tax=Entomophthora muscae TaxID=34485 RepID=A0ACC2RPZ9_9FUNG|nr:hypothetical protein DSO57_1037259 [Entomophthora muscae]
MLDLLQQDPKLPLTQVQKQLAHHNIWVSECMVQLWMHRKVAFIWVLTNFAGNQWDGAEDSPYDTAIKSTLVRCLTSLTDDIMFVSYYKLSIAFDNFSEQGKAATKNGRKKVKKGTFIGAFLAVSAKGFVYYQTNPGFINGYSYSYILGGLLNSWDGSNSKYRVFLSHQIEEAPLPLRPSRDAGTRPQSTPPAMQTSIWLMLSYSTLKIHYRSAALRLSMTSIFVTVSFIMLGIVCSSKKAQKARKPVSKLTKLTDLNQTVD